MTKHTHYYIVLVMVVLIVVVFTLCFAYSLFPGKDRIPRRSKPVIGLQDTITDYRLATNHLLYGNNLEE